MTPPDSGEAICHQCRDGNHEACIVGMYGYVEPDPECACPCPIEPGSGEREVPALECPFCTHPDHADKSCPECGCYRYPADLAVPHKDPDVPVPLSLAQSILAALGRAAKRLSIAKDAAGLAAELRERMPK